MSQNLYQDAIADARKLREMAEQSAKNKIIDANQSGPIGLQ